MEGFCKNAVRVQQTQSFSLTNGMVRSVFVGIIWCVQHSRRMVMYVYMYACMDVHNDSNSVSVLKFRVTLDPVAVSFSVEPVSNVH